MRRINMLASLTCLAALSGAAMGGDISLDGLTPGKTCSGPDLKTKDLTGKLVLVVIWGTQ